MIQYPLSTSSFLFLHSLTIQIHILSVHYFLCRRWFAAWICCFLQWMSLILLLWMFLICFINLFAFLPFFADFVAGESVPALQRKTFLKFSNVLSYSKTLDLFILFLNQDFILRCSWVSQLFHCLVTLNFFAIYICH